MNLEVTFPGGVRVDTTIGAHTVRTDQPQPYGENGAPAPFDLFLASIATCAGFYALRFCQQRELTTEGLALKMTTERDPEKKMTSVIRIDLTTPPDFPEKYNDAIMRAMDQCAVKKHLFDPPQFEMTVRKAE